MSTTEFNAQLQKMTNMLQAFAYHLTRNSEDSRDLYQETAFRVLTNKEKFRPGTNFKAWTFTIMKNIFINNYRKKVKANTVFDATDNEYYLNSGSNAILNSAESSIMIDELNHMIRNLQDAFRIPFLMHYEGFKYQEIANHLELPLGTVKSRIFFARKELKHSIESKYPQGLK